MARDRKRLKERNQTTVGAIGLAVGVMIVFVSLNINGVRSVLGESSFTAVMADTGGARTGDEVRVDGVTVGTIRGIELDGTTVKLTFRASQVRLGDQTRVEVRSDNALGSKYLDLDPAGSGSYDTVPLERTDPGYAVSEVLGELTANNAQIDVDRVAQSFESLSEVLNASPEEFGAALEGLSALSQTIGSRDAELEALLQSASSVSAVLADRNTQILSLMDNSTALFQEIEARRDTLSSLFTQVADAAASLRAFANENAETLAPDLAAINDLALILADYRDELETVLTTFPNYARTLGEAVGSGPWFNAGVANLTAPASLVNDVDGLIQSLLDPTFNPSEPR